MKTTTKIIRISLGLMMVMIGLNGFLNFMPNAAPNEALGAYLGALAAAGFIFPIISIIDIVAGVLLLANKFTPLALIALFVVLLNAFLAHLFLDVASIAMAMVALSLNIFLFVSYRSRFIQLK
jgi:uncharacterized membrane protein YphA (DoxX/SURF4 family)